MGIVSLELGAQLVLGELERLRPRALGLLLHDREQLASELLGELVHGGEKGGSVHEPTNLAATSFVADHLPCRSLFTSPRVRIRASVERTVWMLWPHNAASSMGASATP